VALYEISGFSTQGTAQSMTATVAGATATVASGTYAFADLASVMGTGNYTAFATALVTAFNAAAAGTYTISWSTSTYQWTIYRNTAFTLTFSGASALRLRAALGFSGNPSGAGTVGSPYVSDVRPYYVVVPATDACTNVTDVYEPDDIVDEAVSDGGTPYGVARQTNELREDWTHGFESYAATFTSAAAAAVPWTWQHFVRHVRGQHPFVKYETGLTTTVHKMRADGASFKPQRVTVDDNTYWNMRLLTRRIGTL
jgi:hypothetical protein